MAKSATSLIEQNVWIPEITQKLKTICAAVSGKVLEDLKPLTLNYDKLLAYKDTTVYVYKITYSCKNKEKDSLFVYTSTNYKNTKCSNKIDNSCCGIDKTFYYNVSTYIAYHNELTYIISNYVNVVLHPELLP